MGSSTARQPLGSSPPPRLSRLLTIALALVAGLLLVAGALADTAPIAPSSELPGTDPTHQSPLELLASQISSHIAGRPVSVQCEGDGDWAALVSAQGIDPSAESGYVQTQWNSATGQLVSLSSTAVLSSAICLPLQEFAMATTKPTKCPVRAAPASTAGSFRPPVRPRAGRRSRRAGVDQIAMGPCFGPGSVDAVAMPASFWTSYTQYAIAILTLAHESIHLSGVVGGVLPNGLQVGDPEAEAKADCYGMQWMPYVAEQLGDSPDDAQAIADYFWTDLYPGERTADPAYWSADCRPGGALDQRPPGSTAWP